jgi:hypothetical protein
MPVANVDALVSQYCQQGVKVTYTRNGSDHILLAVTGYGKALSFLQDRLNDVPITSTCK